MSTNSSFGSCLSGPIGSHESSSESMSDMSVHEIDPRIAAAIVTQRNKFAWDNLKGIPAVKNAIYDSVIMPILRPELFTNGRKPAKGVLLFGPPGCGKTSLAKAIASSCPNSTFLVVSVADVTSKYLGESEGFVRKLFNFLRTVDGSILFIDEIEAMCVKRSNEPQSAERRILSEFLVGMDGMRSGQGHFLVVAATNRPDDLDSALIRRFDLRLEVPLPSFEDRHEILKSLLIPVLADVKEDDMKKLGILTSGFSGADLGSLVSRAAMLPVRELDSATHFRRVFETNGSVRTVKFMQCETGESGAFESTVSNIRKGALITRKINMDDLFQSLYVVKPTTKEIDQINVEQFQEDYGTVIADGGQDLQDNFSLKNKRMCCVFL